jgi:predicted RNase H-like HicB family nuclease
MITAADMWTNEGGCAVRTGGVRFSRGCRLDLLISKDENELFSAVVLNLPGVGSHGTTEEEAIQKATEAFFAAKSCYEEGGEGIPWDPNYVVDDAGAKIKKVIVHG